ncbi:serine/threonine-protein kinase [Streptomyces marincola]|uniref:hypothetical protein n=1 Tax=Streptomyces marincola TaxID=2878388 RepID=UPI001CF33173|nr:hypothetical protein [Streptomyces marincola]UCM88680.1 hypothetical protein LC193_12340 [Streptomyces marincola]
MPAAVRLGNARASVRVVPDSPYSVVCVAVDRGYLDDPPACTGLAHLFEHVWFARDPDLGTLAWGETRENAVLLHHACPPEEVAAVVDAVARRLDDGDRRATAPHIAAARALIGLERRGLREDRLRGFPRLDIARALRGDRTFDPVAVTAAGLDPPAVADAIRRFPAGRAHALAVVGPTASPTADDLARLLAGAVPGAVPGGDRATGPPALLPRERRAPEEPRDAGGGDAGACARAWVLPSGPEVAAAAWLGGSLLERRSWPAPLRWASGRVVSPRGVAPVRGGQLYAVAAGTAPAGTAARRPNLVDDVLLPALHGPSDDLRLAREAVAATRFDTAELAAIDALDLLAPGRAGRHDDVLDAVRRADAGTLRAFGELLASSPSAAFRARPGTASW